MGQATLTIVVLCLTDFVITAATGMSTAMMATEKVAMPGTPVIILSVLGGVIAAARSVRSYLAPAPVEAKAQSVIPTKPAA